MTKLDVAHYYLAIGPGIVNALRERPCMMHRFPKGLAGDKVHQKRVPSGAPPWLETVRVRFPRYDRDADELCVTKLADVIWAVQMSIRDPARERGRQCLRTTCSWPSLTLVSTVAVCRQNRGSRTQVAELGGVGHPDDPQLVLEDPRFQRTERGDPSDRIVASMPSFPLPRDGAGPSRSGCAQQASA